MRIMKFALFVAAAVLVVLDGAIARPRARSQDPALFRSADAPANAVWVDSLDLSKAAIRRPRRTCFWPRGAICARCAVRRAFCPGSGR